jgi:hypothetical protein
VEIPGKPYTEYKLEKDISIRVFSLNTEDNELKWHKDLEDRIIWSVKDSNWSIQLDNEFPICLNSNKKIKIKKGVYHRLIKGDNDLVLLINKIYK